MVVEICGGTDGRCWRVSEERASGWCVRVSDPSSLEEGSYVSSKMGRRLRWRRGGQMMICCRWGEVRLNQVRSWGLSSK